MTTVERRQLQRIRRYLVLWGPKAERAREARRVTVAQWHEPMDDGCRPPSTPSTTRKPDLGEGR